MLVVIGNPPYSGHSANPSKHADGSLTHIGKLMQEYFQVDGHSLNERNPKWLQDDYVKFIRFAQEARPWVDLAPWVPRGVYNWAAIAILVGFSWTFGRGEIRGALLTIPILSGILWLIGWLDVSWLLVGVILMLGILVYMRLAEEDLSL